MGLEPHADAQRPTLPLDLQREPLRDAAYVAALLGVPHKSVLQYARDGRLPHVRVGRHVRFIVRDVEHAVAAMRVGVPRLRPGSGRRGQSARRGA
jgi:excisionase family DNA binding protein